MTISLITSIPAVALERDFPEAKIKVAYLFNFLRFIDWPEDYESDVHICVVGDKKEYHAALDALGTQTLNDQVIIIKKFTALENIHELTKCRIIFVTTNASHRQKIVLNSVKGTSALTVGESEGFAEQGGMINFIQINHTIRFEINLHSVNQANLRITSRILRIAERVIEQY